MRAWSVATISIVLLLTASRSAVRSSIVLIEAIPLDTITELGVAAAVMKPQMVHADPRRLSFSRLKGRRLLSNDNSFSVERWDMQTNPRVASSTARLSIGSRPPLRIHMERDIQIPAMQVRVILDITPITSSFSARDGDQHTGSAEDTLQRVFSCPPAYFP